MVLHFLGLKFSNILCIFLFVPIKAAMPGSECSVFFVVVPIGQLSFKHIWFLVLFSPIPSNFGVGKTREKLLLC